jgi:hypothetical protein
MKFFKKMTGVLIGHIYLVLGGEIDPDLQVSDAAPRRHPLIKKRWEVDNIPYLDIYCSDGAFVS